MVPADVVADRISQGTPGTKKEHRQGWGAIVDRWPIDLEHSEKGKSVLKNQTHDSKDGALSIQYCWPARERLYKLL